MPTIDELIAAQTGAQFAPQDTVVTTTPPGMAINYIGNPAKIPRRSSRFFGPKPDPQEDTAMILDAKEGFQFGADPELFVLDPKGRYVSAAGLIPGDKDNPHKVEGGAVQVDGMAAEFNIDPVTTFKDFNRNIDGVMKQLGEFLPKGYTLSAVPAVVFDEDVFDSSPDDAKVLGCSPDFNAWTGEVNPPPADPDDPRMRCAAGHLHIGWVEGATMDDVQHILNCRDLVKQLDWYLGAWSIKMDPDPTRRKLYGRAGACRYKSYGVEYRVLSNFWVTTRERRLAVWNRTQRAIDAIAQSYLPDRAPPAFNEMLIDSINETTLDRALAENFRYPISNIDPSYARY